VEKKRSNPAIDAELQALIADIPGSVSIPRMLGACSVALRPLHVYKMQDGNFSIATDGTLCSLLHRLQALP